MNGLNHLVYNSGFLIHQVLFHKSVVVFLSLFRLCPFLYYPLTINLELKDMKLSQIRETCQKIIPFIKLFPLV
jgi:hypothetical protein